MNRETLQDEALKLAEGWRQVIDKFDERKIYLISGKQLKQICKSFEVLTDSLAQVVEKL